MPYKDYKAVVADLKQVFLSTTEPDAAQQVIHFGEKWDNSYPQISQSWTSNWHNLTVLCVYPSEISKAIYTTNAIESLNSVVRKATRTRELFPGDDSARKVVYLDINEAPKRWTILIRNWKLALSRFSIVFSERVSAHLLTFMNVYTLSGTLYVKIYPR